LTRIIHVECNLVSEPDQLMSIN